jgi:hypothetical protein
VPVTGAGPARRRALELERACIRCWRRRSPLSIALDGKGAFISGQNGVGKSTFLRMLGLNLVAARAFGFCYAQAAQPAGAAGGASMQNEDSLLGGREPVHRRTARARGTAGGSAARPGICLVDEIFRGTNHWSRCRRRRRCWTCWRHGLVMVSSHNLVLAPLLAHRLAPLCVARGAGALALSSGVLAHTNGIALLAQRGFGGQVEANGAGKVFDWLSAYLAHPADGARVLSA